MAVHDGGPAFPHEPHQLQRGTDGISLRDYFAIKALQAEIITTCSDATPEAAEAAQRAAGEAGRSITDHLALNAYEWADAMFRARGHDPAARRLADAAPDLLASLREFLDIYSGTLDMVSAPVKAKLDRARAAVAKAEGGR